MNKKEAVSTIANVLLGVFYVYGVVLGFKASFNLGLLYCVLVITPIVTGLLHLVTGFHFNLATWIVGFVTANPGVLGVGMIVALALLSYALLKAWWKVISMFSHM